MVQILTVLLSYVAIVPLNCTGPEQAVLEWSGHMTEGVKQVIIIPARSVENFLGFSSQEVLSLYWPVCAW